MPLSIWHCITLSLEHKSLSRTGALTKDPQNQVSRELGSPQKEGLGGLAEPLSTPSLPAAPPRQLEFSHNCRLRSYGRIYTAEGCQKGGKSSPMAVVWLPGSSHVL